MIVVNFVPETLLSIYDKDIYLFFKESDEENDIKTGNAMKFPEYYIII
jgi:hypothetical protein